MLSRLSFLWAKYLSMILATLAPPPRWTRIPDWILDTASSAEINFRLYSDTSGFGMVALLNARFEVHPYRPGSSSADLAAHQWSLGLHWQAVFKRDWPVSGRMRWRAGRKPPCPRSASP